MSQIEVDKVIPQSGTALQVGESGDTITIPAGATITNNGTATGFDTDTNDKVKVSSNDTTPGFLNGKLVAGTNISLTEGSDGGNETLTAALTGTIATAQIADANVTTAKIADDAITLAKMAPGTDGNIISYDASGNPVAVATGSAGQILTSAGTGAPPTFADASGGDYVKLSSGTTGSVSQLLFSNSVFDSNYSTHIIELNLTSSSNSDSGYVDMFYDDASTFSSGFTNVSSISLQMNSSNSSPEMSGGEENNGVMRIATDGWKSNAGQQPIIIECHNMRTAYVKYFYWRALHINHDADQRLIVNYGGGCARTVSTTSSLKFASQNGWNFSETKYAVYGVK